MRPLAFGLAAALALAGCKSEDKPKAPEPAKPLPTAGEMKEKAAETAEQVQEKAETAADKAKAALEAAKDKVKAAGEIAVDKTVEAITDADGARRALEVLETRLKRALDDVQNAPNDHASKAAIATLERLRKEKERLEEKLAALRIDEKAQKAQKTQEAQKAQEAEKAP